MYRFEIFRVSRWGLLYLFLKISLVYVIASGLCEHSNLVRFEKRAAETPQHGHRYGNILMLYGIINTYGWLSCYEWHELCFSNKGVRLFHHILFSGQIHYLNIKHEWALTPPLLCWYATSGAGGLRSGNKLILCKAKALTIQWYEISQYFQIGPMQNWFISWFLRQCSLYCSTESCWQILYITLWLFVFISAYLSI